MITDEDKIFSKMAITMADQSEDKTSYKKVGCIIVKDGKVVGRGYRKTVVFCALPYRDITYHAEHLALMEAKEKASGATLYCTLEPCSHRKTGDFNALKLPDPCSQLIFDSGIKRVVFIDRDEKSESTEFFKSKGIKVDRL